MELLLLSIYCFFSKFYTIAFDIIYNYSNNSSLGKMFYLRHFFLFTTQGHYLSIIYILWNIFYNSKFPNILFAILYNLLFTITISFWILYYPIISKIYPNINKAVFFINHGPLLIYFTTKLNDYRNSFTLLNSLYSTLYGFGWLLFFWYPWKLITGDTMYLILSDNLSYYNKIKTIFKIITVNIVSTIFANTIIYFL